MPFAHGKKRIALIDGTAAACGSVTSEPCIFFQERASGADLKAHGTMLHRALAGFMSFRATVISSERDFIGKTIGVYKFAAPLYR